MLLGASKLAQAIADAEALDKELTAEIGERAAKFGEDSTEIARLKSQISEDATWIRHASGTLWTQWVGNRSSASP